jgi:Zn-finger nucleic acid-binding protein
MTMNCPRCQDSELDERTRDSVVVDACPRCRGIWLDRGELEKLIARATSELEQYGRHETARAPESRVYEGEPPSSRRGAYGAAHGKHYRKKGLLESLGDIFD